MGIGEGKPVGRWNADQYRHQKGWGTARAKLKPTPSRTSRRNTETDAATESSIKLLAPNSDKTGKFTSFTRNLRNTK